MGAITSRRKALLPNIIKEFRDGADSGVLCYSGWYGVGTSAAAKAVAKAAKERKLFDPVIFVTAGRECRYALGKLQRKIAKELRIIYPNQIRIDDDDDDDDDENPDEELARMIYQLLEARNFLLIIVLKAGALRHLMNESLGPTHFLDVMGVIIPRSWSKSRILITSLPTGLSDKYKVSLEDQRRSDQLVFPGTIDDVLDQFREEAGYVASCSVPEVTVISADQVYHCSLYCLLLVKNLRLRQDDVIKYWIGEGLIILQQQQDGDDIGAAFKLGEAVFRELNERYMLENYKLREILEADRYHYLKSRLHIQIFEKDFTPPLQHDARWISLANYNNIRTFVCQPLPPTSFSQLSTLFLNDNPQLEEIPPNFFQGMPSLKVLDLSRTSISSLPPSLSCLVNLTFLSLQKCPLFTSLPPTLNHLKQLIILDVAGTPLSNIPEQSFDRLHSLRLIDLSKTNIRLLPPSISSLCNLQQLLLADCICLTSLLPTPKSSLINLASLEKLVVAGCSALEEVQLSQLRQLSTLEELDISECGALKDVVDFSFEGMAKLRDINLSHNRQIARVSLRSCGSLEIARLEALRNIKWLDLSGTKIKKFRLQTSNLEHLDLTNVRYLDSVGWERIRRLPTNLKWDQCGCRVEDVLAENRDDSIARISVSDPRIFRGLGSASPLWDACFRKFHFCISPCSNQGKKKAKKTVVDVKRGKPLAYAAVHSKIMSCSTAFISSWNNNFSTSLRQLEIEEVNRLRRLDDINVIVNKTGTLSLRSNGFLKSMTGFLPSSKPSLKECRVERCHNMLLLTDNYYNGVFVESLWMSDLKRLGSLISGKSAFIGLKHLHIQCCPNLKMLLLGTDWSFPMLETLIIRFCARLECFFKDESIVGGSEGLFPRLHTLHLWELPKLERICAAPCPLPALQKLRVRACPKLRHINKPSADY